MTMTQRLQENTIYKWHYMQIYGCMVQKHMKTCSMLGMVIHAYYSSTQEVETGSGVQASTMQWVWNQPGTHETPFTFRGVPVCKQIVPGVPVCKQIVPVCPDHIASYYRDRIWGRTLWVRTAGIKIRTASGEGARNSLSHYPSAQSSAGHSPNLEWSIQYILYAKGLSLPRSTFCLSCFVSYSLHLVIWLVLILNLAQHPHFGFHSQHLKATLLTFK